jgi:hypothetical protein
VKKVGIKKTYWAKIIGRSLIGLSFAAFFTYGWFNWSYILISFPEEAWKGVAGIEEWLIVIYGIEIPMLLIAGVLITRHHKSAFTFSLITIFYTYFVLGILLATGNWPFERMIDRGSIVRPLMFGDKIIASGDSMPYLINPQLWLISIFLLTIIFIILTIKFCKIYEKQPSQ